MFAFSGHQNFIIHQVIAGINDNNITLYKRKFRTMIPSQEVQVQAAFQLYCDNSIVFRNQSRRTEEQHFLALKSLIKHVGDIPLSDLTFADVRDWKRKMEQENKSPSTIRGYIIKLRNVLKYMRKQGVDCLDPDEVPIPKVIQRVPVYITRQDVTSLIEASSVKQSRMNTARNKAIISLLYSSGIRVSELCHLNREDMKASSFTLVGKGGKARLCFIDERTQWYLKEYLDMRTYGYKVMWLNKGKPSARVRYSVEPDSLGALFLNHQEMARMTAGGVQEILRNARRKAHLTKRVSPHTLRHTFATENMMSGMHMYTLQRLMGHASISTTEVYLHISDPQLEEEYKRYHRV